MDWIHWGIIGHELAHGFLYQSSFTDFCSGLSNSAAYSEGMASALSVSSLEDILSAPERFGLSPVTVATFKDKYLGLVPDNIRFAHYQALTNYEANPIYTEGFNADLCDAIMLKLEEEYGPTFMFRLMSVFYPPDELFMSYQNETQRLTFWVAACSAAARADLRSRFRDRWGYPIDEAFYAKILPLMKQRASQRDPVITFSSASSNTFLLTSTAVPDTAYVIQRSTDLKTWTNIRTNIASGFTIQETNAMSPETPRQFFRVQQRR